MIKLSGYHVHTEFCDGRSKMEDTVKEAIARGCPEIGFTPHSPLPCVSDWEMKKEFEVPYLETVDFLRKQYEKQIKVYKGIEFDITSDIDTGKYDYVIGSVHDIHRGDKYYSVDRSVNDTRLAINEAFGGDPYAYCEEYYSRVATVYQRTKCNIIGHFDLVTKFIEIDPAFDENHPRYRKAADSAFDILAQTPAIFEVNTGAIHRKYRTTPYPSKFILDRIKSLGKPVVVTPDSHSADTVDFLIDEWGERLVDMGIDVVTSMAEILKITSNI